MQYVSNTMGRACGGVISTQRFVTVRASRSTISGRPSAPVPNLFDVQRQIEQYIDSGRYDADFARVAAEALAYVEQRAGALSNAGDRARHRREGPAESPDCRRREPAKIICLTGELPGAYRGWRSSLRAARWRSG